MQKICGKNFCMLTFYVQYNISVLFLPNNFSDAARQSCFGIIKMNPGLFNPADIHSQITQIAAFCLDNIFYGYTVKD